MHKSKTGVAMQLSINIVSKKHDDMRELRYALCTLHSGCATVWIARSEPIKSTKTNAVDNVAAMSHE